MAREFQCGSCDVVFFEGEEPEHDAACAYLVADDLSGFSDRSVEAA